MKKLLFLVAVLLTAGNLLAQTWTWDREPEAGQNVMITITDVPESGPIHAVYYCFEGTKLIAGDVGMLPSDDPSQINLALALHDHVSWVRVVLKDESNRVKSGDDKMVKNATAHPKAGLVESTLAASGYGRLMALEMESDQVIKNLKEAVAVYPDWLDNSDVFQSYYMSAKRASAEEELDMLSEHLNGIASKPSKTSEDMMVRAVRVAEDMGDSTLQKALRKNLDKKFPKSALQQEEDFVAFRNAQTVDEKIKLRDKFKATYKITDKNKGIADQMTAMIVESYGEEENWTMVSTYTDQIIDPMTRARVCNQYAWQLSGESIEAEAPNLLIAESMSAASLVLVEQESTIPVGYTKKEWAPVVERSKGSYADTYAMILFKQGKYEEAVTQQSFAVVSDGFQNGEINERYVIYLEKAEHYKDMEKVMDKMIVEGKATAKVKEIHKNYWTKTASPEQLYAQYEQKLADEAKALLRAKVQEMWIDTEAPAFTLKDLNGTEVSLSDYAGKAIVVDFWATWCGPCKASFPGMKMAVEHYASDQNVVFLFVDTWESGDNIQGKVSDFIDSNNYPFHVLMDSANKVVADFGVSGIPTKFIIGPDQKIHFKAVGYSGNNDELVEELKMMIEMVQVNAGMARS